MNAEDRLIGSIIAVCIFGLFGAGYALGHRTAKTVTETKIVHDKITVEGDSIKDDTGTVVDHSVETTTKPDGTKVEVKHDIVTKTAGHEVAKALTTEVKSEAARERRVTPVASNNRVTLDLGLTLSRDRFGLPIPPPYSVLPVVVGARYSHRIVGGIWADVWLNSNKSAGIGASLEF